MYFLAEGGDRGVFSPAPKVVLSGDGVGPWLVEAGLVSRGRGEYPLRALVDGVSFYPLDLAVSVGDVSRSPRLELCRQGVDEDIVVLKAMSGGCPARPSG